MRRSLWPLSIYRGRVACVVDDQLDTHVVGDLVTELVPDFFDGFARGAKANVHIKTMYGRNNHHKIEAIFKAFARAMRGACSKGRADAGVVAEHGKGCCEQQMLPGRFLARTVGHGFSRDNRRHRSNRL